MIRLGKSKKDIIRYIVLAVVFIAMLIVLRNYWSEITGAYFILILLGVLTFNFEKKSPYFSDVFFLIVANGFGIYFNHLISIYEHYVITASNIDSVIVFGLIQGFGAVAIELMFISLMYFLLRLCRVPQRIAAVISPFPTLLLCVIDYFVYAFRGSELTFFDFYNWRTAMNVVGNYKLDFSYPILFCFIPFALFAFACIRVKTPTVDKNNKADSKKKLIATISYAIVSVLLAVGIVVVVITKGAFIKMWDDNLSMTNGYITGFAYSVKNSRLAVPDGYDAKEFDNITAFEPNDNEKVNIIVIMNESYSDMSIYEDLFDSYEEPAPYWKELVQMDNVRSGFAYSSVYGGLTANSEFEFLAGLSMADMPYSLTPYTTFISDDMYSFPKYLSDNGYATTAMHPYLANGWNRVNVYSAMNFDEFLSLDDFDYTDADIIRGSAALHQNTNLLSDKCAYENLLQRIDSDTDDQANFYFLITIQNHGGYEAEYERYGISQYVSGSGMDEELNVFLSNIRRSDEALEYLVDELSERDEKYLVLIFGDHQPQIDFQPQEAAYNGPDGKMWQVPYIIWTNYDMPDEYEGSDIDTSINYFALELMDIAGMNYSRYFEIINDVREEIPVIHSQGFYDKNKEIWISDFTNCDEKYKNLIKQYDELRYYNLKDYS